MPHLLVLWHPLTVPIVCVCSIRACVWLLRHQLIDVSLLQWFCVPLPLLLPAHLFVAACHHLLLLSHRLLCWHFWDFLRLQPLSPSTLILTRWFCSGMTGMFASSWSISISTLILPLLIRSMLWWSVVGLLPRRLANGQLSMHRSIRVRVRCMTRVQRLVMARVMVLGLPFNLTLTF